MSELIDYLRRRRSVVVKHLVEPGPSREQLQTILEIATRVPDHKKLAPWRVVMCNKAAQAKLGEAWAARYATLNADNPEVTEKHIAHERERPQRAPLLVAVISAPVAGSVPAWEQELSAGALCMNLLHAAYAHGFAGQWLTEWPAYDEAVLQSVGGKAGERIAGLIYIGTPSEAPTERDRPDLNHVVTWL